MSLDKMKIVFLYFLLLVLAALAITFGIGHVEEKSSFGLNQIITGLLMLASAAGQWAFTKHGEDAKDNKADQPKEPPNAG